MVLSHWLERGLGQWLAPDEKYESQADVIDTQSSVWQTLAPDPHFSPDKQEQQSGDGQEEERQSSSSSGPPPPAQAFRQAQQQAAPSSLVECIHCHQQTPLPAGMMSRDAAYSTPFYPRGGSGGQQQQQQQHPKTPMTGTGLDVPHSTQQEILKASFDTGNMRTKNKKYNNDFRNCIAYANQVQPPTAKVQEKVRLILETDLLQQQQFQQQEETNHERLPLYEARALDFKAMCPDGFTLLMAAAHKGVVWYATLLLEVLYNHQPDGKNIVRQQLRRTDLLGQTAMHLATAAHHVKMVDLLESYEQKLLLDDDTQQPATAAAALQVPLRLREAVDVTGRTPFAMVMTSPTPTKKMAIAGKAELEKRLYSCKDPSLLGSQAPAWQRTQAYPKIQTVMGTAHINGLRVWNEDALYYTQWEYCPFGPESSSEKKEPLGFFIICDGHGDMGSVSEKVSLKLPQKLRDEMNKTTVSSDDDWTNLCTTACTTVDQELRTDNLAGGSTAIFCIVTNDKIIVANVGDSRCILVENKPTALSEISNKKASAANAAGETTVEQLSETMGEQLSLSGTEGSPAAASPPSPQETTTTAEARSSSTSSVVVTALSQDHKADIPEERERVEKAGLEIREIEWEEDGNQMRKVRVRLSDTNNVDFSRSFGDFEYKANKDLPEDKQAIVAIPEVRIIDRHSIASESYIVLSCDGVWDVKSNQDVADFVTNNVHARLAADTGEDILSNVGDDLLQSSLEADSKDNLTTIIVALSQAAEMVSPQRNGADASTPARNLDFSSPQK